MNREWESRRGALIDDIVAPKKDAAVASNCSAAAGTSMNRVHPLFVKGGNNSRSPRDDLFGRTYAKLTALIAAPGVPNAVSVYSRGHQYKKCLQAATASVFAFCEKRKGVGVPAYSVKYIS